MALDNLPKSPYHQTDEILAGLSEQEGWWRIGWTAGLKEQLSAVQSPAGGQNPV